ncbi:hypothetical protein BDR06DRAFT_877095 [Suillus hirtellus]|nr:hypothetical protein BDR06DRAFT_877095 [Suillus hirtellus]
MNQVLNVLQGSTIVSKSGKDSDKRSRLWEVYKRVAEERDNEFLDRYAADMESILLFSGLFSAVSTAFIIAMQSNLSPDPSDTTNALLKQLVQIGLGNLAEAGSTPAEPASTWSPTTRALRIQMVAYASLSMSLLAAFGAVLCKQWLGYYKSTDMAVAHKRNEQSTDKRSSTALSLGILMLSCNPFRSCFRCPFFSLGSPSAPICGTSSRASPGSSSQRRFSDLCSIP